MKQLMRKITLRVPALALLMAGALVLPQALLADAVFLKDGSIVEGTIQNQDKEVLLLITASGIKMEIPGESILRINTSDNFKIEFTITLKEGTTLRGYIVEEDEKQLVVRMVLNEKKEKTVYKKDVSTIVDGEGRERDVWLQAKKPYYSPQKAMLLSLIPAWSGSFMPGYNGIGVGLCVGKSFSILLPLMIPLAGKMSSKEKIDSDSSSSSGINWFETDSMRNMAIGCAVSWAVFTAIDIFYSYRYITKINRQNELDNTKEALMPGFSFSPRTGSPGKDRMNNLKLFNGIDASVVMVF